VEHEVNIFLLTIISSIVAGVYLIILAHRIQVPAIVPLLIGGVALGPEGLGFINPSAVASELNTVISFAVAIILFEGGLSLDPQGFHIGKGVIKKLLSVGVLTTWLGSSVAVWLLFSFPFELCLLAGSLIIVTGPTVINPLLKRIRVKSKIHHILHYEGVLIDPIGVFITLLCLEWVSASAANAEGIMALGLFVKRLFFGSLFGFIGGYGIDFAVKKLLKAHEELVNLFVFSTILAIFGICDYIVAETGLLSVTIAGFIIGVRQPPFLKKIKQFQVELTDLSIALLFVLLAASLKFEGFANLGYKGIILLVVILFVIRPLGVFLSSHGEDLNIREKLMLSWLAPRGIVAASMASVVGITLANYSLPGADFMPAFVFAVIGVTVIFQGFTAGFVAKLLNVLRPPRRDWLIISAHKFSIEIAKFIENNTNRQVFLLDANTNNVEAAKNEGLLAYCEDAFDSDLRDWDEFLGVGNILVLTDNRDLNISLCRHWKNLDDRVRTYRWSNKTNANEDQYSKKGRVVFADLPKPTLVSHQIETGILLPSQEGKEGPSMAGNIMEIATFAESRVILTDNVYQLRDEIDPGIRSIKSKMARLQLRLPKEPVTKLLSQHRILFMKTAKSSEDLFEKMLDPVIEEFPHLLKSKLVKDFKLIGQERPLILDVGATVNHVYSEEITDSICVFARLEEPISGALVARNPIKMVFLIISPVGQQIKHLKLLASVARLLSNKAATKKILEADEVVEVLAVLKNFDKK
jgi:NhaP-type Na+/H+ or K+/H+ antiporter/mannitol/fructose-specific phosphotransferase system IIA component (Ntr-type)